MKEVTMEQFYNVIGPLDVVLSVIGNYPYTTEFRMRRSRELKGKSVDSINEVPGEDHIKTKYLLNL